MFWNGFMTFSSLDARFRNFELSLWISDNANSAAVHNWIFGFHLTRHIHDQVINLNKPQKLEDALGETWGQGKGGDRWDNWANWVDRANSFKT